jgi:hypothetical protein
MLVCNISSRPARRPIAADLSEIADAEDAIDQGNVVFATLVDDPGNATDTLDAFTGQIMLEPASATDTPDAYLPAVYPASITEAASATDTPSVSTAVLTTWNPADKSSNAVLSNGNMTVNTNTSADGGARSTTSQTTGKFYFEQTYTAGGNQGGDTGVGIAIGTTSIASIAPSAAGAIILYTSGNVWYNGSNRYSLSGFPLVTYTACFAVDLVNGRFWVRADAGNWNGNATYDPATNVGGYDISAVFSAGVPCFGIATANSTIPVITANFGATAFAQAVPSGFVAWNSN